ncbi:alpha/beta fold hydrolase [Collimonas sp. NPDC087041]|uniref:alpha/beta fold hydrolase n=1 Tax=Collimonas sp. NPDC087041 TaxID=3363960 RepID=UPI00380175ED
MIKLFKNNTRRLIVCPARRWPLTSGRIIPGIAIIACLGAFCSSPSIAQSTRGIAWLPTCPDEGFSAEVFARTQCGIVTAPLDHLNPSKGDIQFEIRRVRAKNPTEREGAIFTNPGGPGIPGGFFVMGLAEVWGSYKTEAPGGDAFKRITERFDLIGISPRGTGSVEAMRFDCRSDELIEPQNDVTDDRSAENIRAIRRNAGIVARGCLAQKNVLHINSDQTARDMEFVCVALKEKKLNYFGVSYGTWLGAWYGSLFPRHVGRMVLDSNMDWTKTFQAAGIAQAPSREAIFNKFSVEHAAANPEIYGMGSNPAAIRKIFLDLQPRVRAAARFYFSPESLMAARAISFWLQHAPDLDKDTLLQMAQQHVFSSDATVNQTAKSIAGFQISSIFDSSPTIKPGPLNLNGATRYAVACNDTFAGGDAYWTAKENEYAQKYPFGGSDITERYCAQWRAKKPVKPPVEQLAKTDSLLLVQAEFDHFTPAAPAFHAFANVPNASMVYIEGVNAHGIFTYAAYPCVNQHVAAYLAYGAKPQRLTVCPKPDETPASLYTMHSDPERIEQIILRMKEISGDVAPYVK